MNIPPLINPINHSKTKFLIPIIIFLCFFLFLTGIVWPAEYTITQITNNNYGDYGSQIHNGQIVWEGKKEIFFYDGSRTIQLTNNDYNDERPQIHNGQVTWERSARGDVKGQILLYNGSRITQLADYNYTNNWYPQIHNGQVTWIGWDGYDSEIFLYDGTQTRQLTNNDYQEWSPQIHNGQVTWMGTDDNDYEIFLYDSTQTIQLTNNDYLDFYPQIHKGQVVWYGYDGNDFEIFFYDGTQTRQLTNNDYDDHLPRIHNGQVTWYGYDGNDWEIFLYDGTQTTQLTDNDYHDWYSQIRNGQVTWFGYDGNDFEIFFYDGNQITQFTNNSYDDYVPQIHNDQIVWYGYDGNDWEIFLATLGDRPTLEILDGVDFTAGKEISSNPEKLVSGGTPATAATADGVTRLLLRLNVEKSNKVTFSLQGTDNGVLRSIDGSEEGSSITVNTVDTSEGEAAFAIYQAPGNFVRLGYPEDEDVSERLIALNVKLNFSPALELSEEIKLVRPPVILVHGLWSGPEMWDENDFRDILANKLSGIRIFTPNYKKTNAGYFSVNKAVLKKKIEKVKEELRSQQIAMIQANVIGHSMGGLLARIWAEAGDGKYYRDNNFGMGDINKLITLDSPHFGSFLADIGMKYLNDLKPERRKWILEEFRRRERPLDGGAIEDMMTTSKPIDDMNKTGTIPASHAIIGEYPVTPIEFWFLPGVLGWTHRLLTLAKHDTRPYVVNARSDLVVSMESQAGGLVPPASSDSRHHHMNATTLNVVNEIIYLLNGDPEMWLFNPGFPVKK